MLRSSRAEQRTVGRQSVSNGAFRAVGSRARWCLEAQRGRLGNSVAWGSLFQTLGPGAKEGPRQDINSAGVQPWRSPHRSSCLGSGQGSRMKAAEEAPVTLGILVWLTLGTSGKEYHSLISYCAFFFFCKSV